MQIFCVKLLLNYLFTRIGMKKLILQKIVIIKEATVFFSIIQLYNYTIIQLYNYTIIQLYNYTIIQLYNYTIIQLYNYTISQYIS